MFIGFVHTKALGVPPLLSTESQCPPKAYLTSSGHCVEYEQGHYLTSSGALFAISHTSCSRQTEGHYPYLNDKHEGRNAYVKADGNFFIYFWEV